MTSCQLNTKTALTQEIREITKNIADKNSLIGKSLPFSNSIEVTFYSSSPSASYSSAMSLYNQFKKHYGVELAKPRTGFQKTMVDIPLRADFLQKLIDANERFKDFPEDEDVANLGSVQEASEEQKREFSKGRQAYVFSDHFTLEEQASIQNQIVGFTLARNAKLVLEGKPASILDNEKRFGAINLYYGEINRLKKIDNRTASEEKLLNDLRVLTSPDVWALFEEAAIKTIRSKGYAINSKKQLTAREEGLKQESMDKESVDDNFSDDNADIAGGQDSQDGKSSQTDDYSALTTRMKDTMSSHLRTFLSGIPSTKKSFIQVGKYTTDFVSEDIIIQAINEATLGYTTLPEMIMAMRAYSNIKGREFLAIVADNIEAQMNAGTKIAAEFGVKFNQQYNNLLLLKYAKGKRVLERWKSEDSSGISYIKNKDGLTIPEFTFQVINVNRQNLEQNIKQQWADNFRNKYNTKNDLLDDATKDAIFKEYEALRESLPNIAIEGKLLFPEATKTAVKNLLLKVGIELGEEALNRVMSGQFSGAKTEQYFIERGRSHRKVGDKFIASKSVFGPYGFLFTIFDQFSYNKNLQVDNIFETTGIFALASTEALFAEQFLNTSVLDGKGRNIWSYGLPNPLTREFNKITKDPEYAKKLQGTLYTNKSLILDKLATLKGADLVDYRDSLKYGVFSMGKAGKVKDENTGETVGAKDSNGKELTNTNPREFFMYQLGLISGSPIQGKNKKFGSRWSYKFLTTPSDKSTMYMMQTPDHNIDISFKDGESTTFVQAKTVERFFNYFMGEYERVNDYLTADKEKKKKIDDITTYEPRIFYNFPQFNLKSGPESIWKDGKLKPIEEIESLVRATLKKQIEVDIANTYARFQELGLIKDGQFIMGVNENYLQSLPQDLSKVADKRELFASRGNYKPEQFKEAVFQLSEDATKNATTYLTADYAINYQLHNMEMQMMFLGDPTQFLKDEGRKLKDSEFQGLGDWANIDSWRKYIDGIRDNMSKRMAGIQASGAEGQFEEGNTANTVVLYDDDPKRPMTSKIYNELNDEQKETYKKIKTLDGSEIITAEEDLRCKRAYGKITEEQYRRLLAKVAGAHEDIKKTGVVSEANKFTREEKFIAQAQKPVVFALIPDSDLNIRKATYYKSAAFALYPQFTQGFELDRLREAAYDLEKKGKRIDRFVMTSAAKLGAKNPIKGTFTQDEAGALRLDTSNLMAIDDSSIDIVPREYFRIQLEVPYDGEKDHISMASQQVKLIFNEIKDLKFPNKLVKHFLPELGPDLTGNDLHQYHDKLFKELLSNAGDKLFSDMGIAYDSSNGTVEYTDLEKLRNILLNQAIDQDYGQAVLDGLQLTADKKGFVVPLAFSATRDRFEKLLLSTINKVILQKMSGRSFILATEQGFVPKKTTTTKTLTGKEAEDFIKHEKTNIVWLSDKDGKPKFDMDRGLLPVRRNPDNEKELLPAQILVTFKFKNNAGNVLDIRDFITEKDGKNFIDTEKIDPEILRVLGIRIPTQGHPSMASVEIVGFLPEGMGDLVIAPQDWTTQFGSDFDIDKLYGYMYNYRYNTTERSNKKLDSLMEKLKLSHGLNDEVGGLVKALNTYTDQVKELKKDKFKGEAFKDYILNAIDTNFDEVNKTVKIGNIPTKQEVIDYFNSLTEEEIKAININAYKKDKAEDYNTKNPKERKISSLEATISEENLGKAANLKKHITTYNAYFNEKIKELQDSSVKTSEKILKELNIPSENLTEEQKTKEIQESRQNLKKSIESYLQEKKALNSDKKLELITEDMEGVDRSEIIQNKLQNIYHAIMLHPVVWEKSLSGIQEGNLKNLAKELSAFEPSLPSEYYSPGSALIKADEFFANQAGKLGVGIFSIANTFFTIIEGKQIGMHTVEVTRSGTVITTPNPFIIKDADGNAREFTTFSNGLGANYLISIFQSASVDNAKLGYLKPLHQNEETMGITAVIAALADNATVDSNGNKVLNEDYIAYWLSQPIVKEFVRGLQTGSDETQQNQNKNWKEDLESDLEEKYEKLFKASTPSEAPKAKTNLSGNYYEILGVDRDATYKEIRKAWRALSLLHHGDRTGEGDEIQKKLNLAWEVLQDKEKKELYDNRLGRTASRLESVAVVEEDYPGYSLQELKNFMKRENQNSQEFYKAQIQIFRKFLELKAVAQEVRNIQNAINADSKGVPKSLDEAMYKRDRIDKLSDPEKENEFLSNVKAVFYETKENGDLILEEGLPIPTLQGLTANLSVDLPINLFSGINNGLKGVILPTGSPRLQDALNEIKKVSGIPVDTQYNAKLGKEVTLGMVAYMQSTSALDIVDKGKSLYQERLDLLEDREDNTSFATDVEEFVKTDLYETSTLLKPLFNSIRSKYNSGLKFAEFKASTGLTSPDEQIIQALEYLRQVNYPLFEKLIKYQLLLQGSQSPVNFRKFIPIYYLEAIGVASQFRALNMQFANPVSQIAVSTERLQVSRFTEQFFQHNPSRVKSANLKFVTVSPDRTSFTVNSDASIQELSIKIAGPNGSMLTVRQPYATIVDMGETRLYKYNYQQGVYHQMDLLGDYNLDEYNSDGGVSRTILEPNKATGAHVEDGESNNEYGSGDLELEGRDLHDVNIMWGDDENKELSNFATRIFEIGGLKYMNVESAFQHAKLMFVDSIAEQPLEVQNANWSNLTGYQAKELGKKIKGLDKNAWDVQSPVLMKTLLLQSFRANSDALKLLLDTGSAKLTHNSKKYGADKWTQKFPEILMEVREELRGENPETKTQSVKPEGKEIMPGVFANQNGLTKEEQLELFNYLKPFIEEQAAKTNKGKNANFMLGLGLRWDYKSNNPKQTPVNLGTSIAGQNEPYGYYELSINEKPLGKFTDRLRELVSRATGIDTTDYDSAIINIYTKDTFINRHPDKSESNTAINYPVVAVNIGGEGNFSIGDNKNSVSTPLEAGAGYLFGFKGKNRTQFHGTTASTINGFLPEVTLNHEGITLKEGDYRISITLRRAMPLTKGMPTEPNLVTKTKKPRKSTYKGKLTKLEPNEVFVFGSNEGSSTGKAPTHGAGAAKDARDYFGAIQGQTRGLQGQSYAIVTKKYYDVEKSSTPQEIEQEIKNLYEYAKQHPEKDFLVAYKVDKTKNLNGYSDIEMANMFKTSPIPSNIVFEEGFNKLVRAKVTKSAPALLFDLAVVDNNVKWSELKGTAVYPNSTQVNVTRVYDVGVEHFGNPFIGSKRQGRNDVIDNITVFGTIPQATEAYENWLNGTDHQNQFQEQRDWILSQINEGKLDSKTLLYYKPASIEQLNGVTIKGYRSHADVLRDMVNNRPRKANPANYTCHSGGALKKAGEDNRRQSSDLVFEDIGHEFGVKTRSYSFKGHDTGSRKEYQVNTDDKKYAETLAEADVQYVLAAAALGKHETNKPYVRNMMLRNWFQVKHADAIFAVGKLVGQGTQVDGGTGYAVQMAINNNKPVYVFNQNNNKWYKWEGSGFELTDTPILTPNFAGIGTRDITDAGVEAIRTLFKRTFNPVTVEQKAGSEVIAKQGTFINTQKLTSKELLQKEYNYDDTKSGKENALNILKSISDRSTNPMWKELSNLLLEVNKKTGILEGLTLDIDSTNNQYERTKHTVSISLKDNTLGTFDNTFQYNFLHEIVHAFTIKTMNADSIHGVEFTARVQRLLDSIITEEHIQKLIDEFDLKEADDITPASVSFILDRIKTLRNKDVDTQFLSVNERSALNGLVDPREFVSMIMSDAKFQHFLSGVGYKDFETTPTTVIGAFLKFLKAMFDRFIATFGFEVKDATALKEGLNIVTDVLQFRGNQKFLFKEAGTTYRFLVDGDVIMSGEYQQVGQPWKPLAKKTMAAKFKDLKTIQDAAEGPETKVKPTQKASTEPVGDVQPKSKKGGNSFTFRDGVTIDTGNIALNVGQRDALQMMADAVTSSKKGLTGDALTEKTKFVLRGYAGTGKSTIISFMVKYLKQVQPGKTIIAATPTHKATSIIKAFFIKNGLSSVKEYTVAKVLNARSIDGVFKPGKNHKVPLNGILIVDEASMVNPEDYDNLMALAEEKGATIIFMGDPAQIPPVSTGHYVRDKAGNILIRNGYKVWDDAAYISPALEYKEGVNGYELTEVMRQKDGNPIIDILTNIRTNITSRIDQFPHKTVINDKGEGIRFVKSGNAFNNAIRTVFGSKNFEEDKTYCKIIAYTNAAVANYNQMIRSVLLDDPSEQFQVGESLMGYTQGGSSETAIHNGNDYVITRSEKADVTYDLKGANMIAGSATAYKEVTSKLKLKGYRVTVRQIFDPEVTEILYKYYAEEHNKTKAETDELYTHSVFIIDPLASENEEAFQELYKLQEFTSNKKIRFEQRSSALEAYSDFIAEHQMPDNLIKFTGEPVTTLAKLRIEKPHLFKKAANGSMDIDKLKYAEFEKNIDYGYAISAHKSQGSTYHTVFVDLDNIRNPNNLKPIVDSKGVTQSIERGNIHYVALSRTSHDIVAYSQMAQEDPDVAKLSSVRPQNNPLINITTVDPNAISSGAEQKLMQVYLEEKLKFLSGKMRRIGTDKKFTEDEKDEAIKLVKADQERIKSYLQDLENNPEIIEFDRVATKDLRAMGELLKQPQLSIDNALEIAQGLKFYQIMYRQLDRFFGTAIDFELKDSITTQHNIASILMLQLLKVAKEQFVGQYNEDNDTTYTEEEALTSEENSSFTNYLINAQQNKNTFVRMMGKTIATMYKQTQASVQEHQVEDNKQITKFLKKFNWNDITILESWEDEFGGSDRVIKNFLSRNSITYFHAWEDIVNAGRNKSLFPDTQAGRQAKFEYMAKKINEISHVIDIRFLHYEAHNEEHPSSPITEDQALQYREELLEYYKEQFADQGEAYAIRRYEEVIAQADIKAQEYFLQKEAYNLVLDTENDPSTRDVKMQDWLAHNSPFTLLNEQIGFRDASGTYVKHKTAKTSRIIQVHTASGMRDEYAYVEWENRGAAREAVLRKATNRYEDGSKTGFYSERFLDMEAEHFEKQDRIADMQSRGEDTTELEEDFTEWDFLDWAIERQKYYMSKFPGYIKNDIRFNSLIDVTKDNEEAFNIILNDVGVFNKLRLIPLGLNVVWDETLNTVSEKSFKERESKLDYITEQVKEYYNPTNLTDRLNKAGKGYRKTEDAKKYFEILRGTALEYETKSEYESFIKLGEFLMNSAEFTPKDSPVGIKGTLGDSASLVRWTVRNKLYGARREEEPTRNFVYGSKWALTKKERDEVTDLEVRIGELSAAIDSGNLTQDQIRRAEFEIIKASKRLGEIRRQINGQTLGKTSLDAFRFRFMSWGTVGRAVDFFNSGIIGNAYEAADGRIFGFNDFGYSFSYVMGVYGLNTLGTNLAVGAGLSFVTGGAALGAVAPYLAAGVASKATGSVLNATLLTQQKAKISQLLWRFGALENFHNLSDSNITGFSMSNNSSSAVKSTLKLLLPYTPMEETEIVNKGISTLAALHAIKVMNNTTGKEVPLVDAFIVTDDLDLLWDEINFGSQEDAGYDWSKGKKMHKAKGLVDAATRNANGDYGSHVVLGADKGISGKVLIFLRRFLAESLKRRIGDVGKGVGSRWKDEESGMTYVPRYSAWLHALRERKSQGTLNEDTRAAGRQAMMEIVVWVGLGFATYLLANRDDDKELTKMDAFLTLMGNILGKSYAEQTQLVNPNVMKSRSMHGLHPYISVLFDAGNVAGAVWDAFNKEGGDIMTRQEMISNGLLKPNTWTKKHWVPRHKKQNGQWEEGKWVTEYRETGVYKERGSKKLWGSGAHYPQRYENKSRIKFRIGKLLLPGSISSTPRAVSENLKIK